MGFVLGCRRGRDLNSPRGQQSREEDEAFGSPWDRLPAVLRAPSLASAPPSRQYARVQGYVFVQFKVLKTVFTKEGKRAVLAGLTLLFRIAVRWCDALLLDGFMCLICCEITELILFPLLADCERLRSLFSLIKKTIYIYIWA